MSQIPESQHTTSAAIIRWYESKPQEHRPHMGASLIGHPCDRYIWLTWRWALKPEFKGRILRLFDTGKREENRLIEELRGIGATVWDVDPSNGDQWRVSELNGHFGGSLDAVAKGLPEAPKSPAVVEMKTHNEKSFNELVKKGVKAAKPQHYDQMNVYMGLMEIPRALYMAVNKNTDDVYVEWLHFDEDRCKALLHRASDLIHTNTPPWRISVDPDHFECKWCSMWKHCHGGMAAEANCRTCVHATPVENSAWHCDKHRKNIDYKQQTQGCDTHLLIPDLIPFADAQEGGENWVAYKMKNSEDRFINGPESLQEYGPNFSSRELHMTNGTLMQDIIKAKLAFPVSKVSAGSLETFFDGIADDIDSIPVKPDAPAKREQAKKIKSAAKAMEGMKK